jgi:hypothetical protein
MSWFNRHTQALNTRVPKQKVRTVLVRAVTSPPEVGFRHGGRRVPEGEEVRVPISDAHDLEARGLAVVIPGTGQEELR